MRPILYDAAETQFLTNGIGILGDALSCVVREELNGVFEAEMRYPRSGVHFDEIALNRLLLIKPNATDTNQPFRIYRITTVVNGVITVYAQHISYDLTGVPVIPYQAGSAAVAVAMLKSRAAVSHGFDFMTDITQTGEFNVEQPLSTRAVIGGGSGQSILGLFGGEMHYDRFNVRILSRRGEDRGASIRYGKNLIDLEQEKSCAETITGILPFAVLDDAVTLLPERVLYGPGTYAVQKVAPVDLSENFESAPDESQLRQAAQEYLAQQRIGVPAVNLRVQFAQLEQTPEYASMALLERVGLGDTVSVVFSEIGVSAQARCVATQYDALLERYNEVEIGDVKSTLADTIVEQQSTISKIANPTYLQASVDRATQLITGNRGGYVVLHSTTGGAPDELLILDQPDIASAVHVWRWNQSGLGYSGTGYNGPYSTAITADGHIVADFIDTGSLTANIIKSGAITSASGNFIIDLSAGTMLITDSGGNIAMEYSPLNGFQVRGTIYALYGSIGGFLLDNGSLKSDALTIDDATGQITFGTSGSVYGLGGSTTNGQGIAFSSNGVMSILAGSTINFNGSGVYFNCPVYDRQGREITGANG
nr:MAG TPA: tail protein [Caudoviricetes sp.]